MDSGTAEMHVNEARGVQLVQTMIDRAGLIGRVPLRPHRRRVVGPGFDYRSSNVLFAGRSGYGPLRVALDTNIVIDYFDHGERLWGGESVVDPAAQDHGEDLEALQMILATWVLRGIHFVMLRQSLRDSKRGRVGSERASRNRNGWLEFYKALTHGGYHEGDEHQDPMVVLPSRIVDTAIDAIPIGGDQRMVRAALLDGAHVYLTRDKKVLRARAMVRPLGTSILTPGELLEELLLCGALNFLWDPASLYWPLPDQEKVAHLIWALPKNAA